MFKPSQEGIEFRQLATMYKTGRGSFILSPLRTGKKIKLIPQCNWIDCMKKLTMGKHDINGKEIAVDKKLVAYCGLYCAACKSYLKGECSGCRVNVKLDWCRVRMCCQRKEILSCAECNGADFGSCWEYHGIVTKLFELVSNYRRETCIKRIRALGYEDYAKEMAARKRQTLKWKDKK
jgi:hypothetical protein